MLKKYIKKIFINWWLTIDKTLLGLYFVFTTLSLIFIFTTSTSVANRINVNNYYFFKHQLFFSILSTFMLMLMSFLNENFFKRLIKPMFILSMILLLMVPFFGFQTKGARRWIYVMGFSIQPTEIIKPTIIVFNAYMLSKFIEKNNFKYLLKTSLLFILSIIFIYKQPDIGTVILITLVFFTQIFLLDNLKIKVALYLSAILLVIFITSYLTLPHVNNRINNFFSSFSNPENINYQVKTSISAYKHSGFLGQGFMEGEIKNYIPDVHTDFILPAISEEFGFVFVFILINLYFYISLRIMAKASKNDDFFKFSALYGLSLLFLIQASINICVSLNLVPTKGMTLPLLSYGGSSLIGTSLTFAIILILTRENFETKITAENSLDISGIQR